MSRSPTFSGFALEAVKKRLFPRAGLVSFFGKAVKQAQGLAYTHAHKARLDLARVAQWLAEAEADPGLVRAVSQANTARHALDIMKEHDALNLTNEVGARMARSARRFAGTGVEVWVRIVDFDGTILYQDP